MPSSTSSSNLRIPDAPHVKSIFLTICLLLAMLIGMELFWRYAGFLPSITNSPLFWAIHRDKVYPKSNERSLVIIGASRTQSGIVPEALEEELPSVKVTNLSIAASTSIEILEDLADDSRFTGIVLWSVNIGFLARKPSSITSDFLGTFHDVVEPYANYDAKFNQMMFAWLQERFVLLQDRLRLRELLRERFRPQPNYSFMRHDRYIPTYYRSCLTPDQITKAGRKRVDPMRAKLARNASVLSTPEDLDRIVLERISPACAKIKERGGAVVMLRMPTTGEYWEIEESVYPKRLFWDRMGQLLDVPMIHFLDNEELSRFDCPDLSHLDAEDAPIFTASLARILAERVDLLQSGSKTHGPDSSYHGLPFVAGAKRSGDLTKGE